MACTSYTALLRECGKNRAGVQDNYLVAYDDLAVISGSTLPYAISVGGVVNQIGLASTKKFVKIEKTRKTGSLKASGQVADNGVATSTVEYSLGLDGFSSKTGQYVDSLLGVPVVIITRLRNGKYIAVGLDGGIYLSNYEMIVDETNNGATLTFTGDTNSIPPEVDPTVIASLI